MQHIPLLIIAGFLVGVGVRSFVYVNAYVLAFLCIVMITALFQSSHLSRRLPLYALMLMGAFILGVVRFEFAEQRFQDGRVFIEGSRIEREGVIVREPDVRENNVLLTVVLDNPSHEDTPTTVLARVPQYPLFEYGDRVLVRGTAHIPEPFETETGRVFDYHGYLMKDGIHYEVRHADVVGLGSRSGNEYVNLLFTTKHVWLNAVSRVIPEPQSSLLGGLVVGAKRSLGEVWLDAFRDTGIVHIVVLSGYNLTIVAVFIIWLTQRYSRRVRLVSGVVAIVSFAIMTGAGATVVRASIMAIIAMVALFFARPYMVLRSLVIAAGIMIAINPFLLLSDPGFQLSFVATLGLIIGSPILERHLSFVPSVFGLRTIVSATLATQCAVLPLLMFTIGEISLVSPLVNILVLPTIPFLMATGFVTGLIASIYTLAALPVAWLTNIGLSYIFVVVDLFASIPYATIMLPPIHPILLFGTYGVAVWYIMRK